MLLRVGAIRLSETADKGSFAVQIRKDIKITTSYPALGIFLIGLLFVSMSIYMTQPDTEIPLSVSGRLNTPDPASFRIQIEPDRLSVNECPDASGRFEKTFHRRIQRVKVTVVASGYTPEKLEWVLDIVPATFRRQACVKLPDDVMERFRKVANNPGAGEIKPVSSDEKLPPVNSTSTF